MVLKSQRGLIFSVDSLQSRNLYIKIEVNKPRYAAFGLKSWLIKMLGGTASQEKCIFFKCFDNSLVAIDCQSPERCFNLHH